VTVERAQPVGVLDDHALAEAAVPSRQRNGAIGGGCDQAVEGRFDVEVLFLAKKLHYKIREVPVTWVYVKTSRLSPFADSLRMLFDVIKVRLNDLKGLYSL
jgi:hypothetical protein